MQRSSRLSKWGIELVVGKNIDSRLSTMTPLVFLCHWMVGHGRARFASHSKPGPNTQKPNLPATIAT